MANFLLIAVCLLAGILSARMRWVGKDGYKALNAWVLYFGLPALAFRYLPKLAWKDSLLFTMLLPVLILAGSVVLFYLLSRFWLRLSRRSSHTLMLVAGLSNTSFVGFPLILAYYGSSGLPVGIVSDQSTFFVLSTLGVLIAIRGGLGRRKQLSLSMLVKRVFRFPAFIACLLALSVGRLVDWTVLDELFMSIGATVSPIALFSIGLQLNFHLLRSELSGIAFASFYKLILAPALAFSLLFFLDLDPQIAQVSVFEMAMPSLVATSIVLDEFKLNRKLGNSVIGLTIPLGLLTSYLWQILLAYFFSK